ncbi:MAG: iron-containing alcohol dehydrogenase [Candidatus Lokiarchaeota archaeon]|nr:iron-containing alcohol dehydrogenase [Candidatus Lokiarchaeota archaeon]
MIKKPLMVKRIYNNPEVYYGKGATTSCLKALEQTRLLFMVSGTVKKSEYYTKIFSSLAGKQIQEEAIASPSQENIIQLVDKYAGPAKPDVIVAIGGGKVLDSAKAFRVLADNPGLSFADLEKTRFCEKASTRLVAIPTTPGTGSEANSIAVTRDASGRKIPMINSGFVPDVAILDHEFLLGHDAQAIFEFSADIFSHAFEGSVSAAGTALLSSIARGAISLLKAGIERVKADTKDPKGLEQILHAGHLAGVVQGNAFVGACHALAHAIEEQVPGVPHGQSILLTLKQTILWLKDTTKKPEYDEFLDAYDAIGFDTYRKTELIKGKLDPDKWAEAALKDPSISTSPVRMKKENLLVLEDWILNRP